MALTTHTPSASRRKHFLTLPGGIGDAPPRPVPPKSLTRHLDADQCARLLAFVDLSDVVTLDAISRALPAVESPISAVFDLCDAGVLSVDLGASLDGDTMVWRLDR